MRRVATCLAFAAALLAQPAVAQNLLTDGSFENPALSSATTFTTIMNGSSFGAWTVTAGSVDLIRTYWAPADGFQSIDLNGNTPGSIAQTFGTVSGKTYSLRFSMAGNPDYSLDKVMRVWWGTQDLGLFTFTQTGQTRANMGWQTITLSGLIASSGSTTLRFDGVNSGPTGIALDNVIVAIVPEPATMLLLATGLLGVLAFINYRRRRTHASRTA